MKSNSHVTNLHKLRALLAGLIYCAPMVSLSGCAVETAALNEEEGASAVTEELTGEYTWNNSTGTVTMIPASQGFCFITGFTGKLRGGGEYVYLDTDASGRWIITGQTQQGYLQMKARCVRWDEFSVSGVRATKGDVWLSTRSKEGATQLGHGSDFCYLAGIGGDFAYGNGEWVNVQPSPYGWENRLNWESGTGLKDRAACVTLRGPSNEVLPFTVGPRTVVRQLENTHKDDHTNTMTVLPAPVSSGFCVISKAAGSFDGGGEFLQLNRTNSWTMSAGSGRGVETQGGTNGILGEAQCMYFQG